MEKAPEEDRMNALPCEDSTQKRPQFKGIRMRKWGTWGSEIRMPKTRAKIWLGSYKTSEQAARAYDAAVYCLRGPNAKFNFPNSVPSIPGAFSLTPRQIQLAAARYARDELPSTSPSSHNNNNNNGVSLASSSCSSSVLETELQSNSKQISGDRGFWESLFDSSACFNFQNFPSIDDTSTVDQFIPISEQQDTYISLDLWSFWESLFDSSACLNFQNFPSIDDTSTVDQFIPTSEQQDTYNSLDLWSF